MGLLNELKSADYLGFTSVDQWRRARKQGQVPLPDVTRGQKPILEFWLEETLITSIKQSCAGELSRETLRRRIEAA